MLFDALACNAMSDKTVGFRASHHIFSFHWLNLSVIRNLNTFRTSSFFLFNSLITGKTSYPNSTSLLMGLTSGSPLFQLPVSVSMHKCRAAIPLFHLFFFNFGGHLLSHTVTSAVPSAAWGLTIVFGMRTGVSLKRIATKRFCYLFRSCRSCPSRIRFASSR